MSLLSRLKEIREAFRADHSQLQADEAKLNELSQSLERQKPQQQERAAGQAEVTPEMQSKLLDYGQKVLSTGITPTPVFVPSGDTVAPHPMQTPTSGSADTQQRVKDPTQDGPVQGQ